jgi:hypothetical protein
VVGQAVSPESEFQLAIELFDWVERDLISPLLVLLRRDRRAHDKLSTEHLIPDEDVKRFGHACARRRGEQAV